MPPEPVVVVVPGDYLDRQSRIDYLRKKMEAEGRLAQFDRLPQVVRVVATGCPTMHEAVELVRCGVRTFEDAERAVAGVG